MDNLKVFILSFSISMLLILVVACAIPTSSPVPPPEVTNQLVTPEEPDVTETQSTENYAIQSFLPLIFLEEGLFNVVPKPKKVEIRMADRNIPENLLSEVSFYPAGGGGGTNCWNEENENYKLVRWNAQGDGDYLPVTSGIVFWCVCALNQSEYVATIELPNGEITQASLWDSPEYWNTVDDDCTLFSIDLGPGTILGEYKFTVEISGTELIDEFTLVIPKEPQGIWLRDRAWFTGFQPLEQVSLWLFSTDSINMKWLLLGEFSLITDENGMLQVTFDEEIMQNEGLVIEALGNDGSIVTIHNFPWEYIDKILMFLSPEFDSFNYVDIFVNKVCVDTLPSRLNPEDWVNVSQDGLMFVPSETNTNEFETIFLEYNTRLKILGNPTCDFFDGSHHWTWQVETPKGVIGQVAESNATQYFLELIPDG